MVNNNELPDLGLEMSPAELDLPAPDAILDLPPLQQEPPVPVPHAPRMSAAAAPAACVKPRPQKAKAPGKRRKKSIKLEVITIGILAFFMAIMFVLRVPLDGIPALSLTSYVQGAWLLLGCIFIISMLQDWKTAMVFTVIDFLILLTVFPTLWLVADMRMNPMYFFVLTLILLIAFIYVPINTLRARRA